MNAARPEQARRFSEILVELGQGESPRLTMREIVNAFDEQALGAVMLLWAVINFIPLPPGGTTITGAPLLLLSMELALRRETLWLPRRTLYASVSRSAFRKSFNWLLPIIRFAENLSRPRLLWLSGRNGRSVIGLICFLLSVVLVLPIPLGNIAPAVTIALFSLGVMQRDGLAVILGYLGAGISAGLLALVWQVVWRTVEHLYDRVLGLTVPIP